MINFKKILAVYKFTEFSDFIIGRFLFVMALKMTNTLIAWWLFQITNNVLYIGFIGLAEVLPSIGLSLYAGYIIDLSEKKKILMRCVLLFSICITALFFLSILLTSNPSSKNNIITGIYIVIFFTGCIKAFLSPIFNTIMPNTIKKTHLPTATTWNSTSWLFGGILGHAIIGFTIAYLGISTSLIIILCLIISALAIFSLILPKPAIIIENKKNSKNSNKIFEGIVFVFKNKLIFGAMLLDLLAIFFGGVISIIPAIATDVLHVDATGYAFLNASADLGSAIMLLTLLIYPIKRKQGQKLFITVAFFGLSVVVLSFSESLLISCIALFVSGLADSANSIIRSTIVQISTPDIMRGKVMGVNTLFTNSSNELGKLESGISAQLLGTMPAVFFGGIMTIVIAGLAFVKLPELRKFEYKNDNA